MRLADSDRLVNEGERGKGQGSGGRVLSNGGNQSGGERVKIRNVDTVCWRR